MGKLLVRSWGWLGREEKNPRAAGTSWKGGVEFWAGCMYGLAGGSLVQIVFVRGGALDEKRQACVFLNLDLDLNMYSTIVA